MTLIFELSTASRAAHAQVPRPRGEVKLSAHLLRHKKPCNLLAVSELDAIRHYTRLSKDNFSIDTHFYPLGSCTMKYNPRGVQRAANHETFLLRHPLSREEKSQGFLQCLYELQCYLSEITGMPGVALSPMAGSQGEFAGVAMIKAYHESRGDVARTEILVPDAAHGTNPASAVMCGYKVKEIPTREDGEIDIEILKTLIGPQTAGIMLTNPSTLGLFNREIQIVSQLIHQAGGLLYYDGANLNAILGKVRPGDMGFDVVHLNLHKTFATPHGGGGPGSGPVCAGSRLLPFLPIPRVSEKQGFYYWLTQQDCPQSIGRLSAFMGNASILLRAYAYIRLLGREGLPRVAEYATLNANYLLAALMKKGYEAAYPERRASHEFIITLKMLKATHNVTAMDVAKRLLDYGIHSPTSYFPLLVPECLLIEPTETESKQTLDHFIDVMQKILHECKQHPALVQQAPHSLTVRRLDGVRAATQLDLTWRTTQSDITETV